jgi:hypothetical protein
MNHPKLLLIFMVLFVTKGITAVRAQSLVIKSKDGTETQKQLCTVQNFVFSNGILVFKYMNGSTDSYSVATIRKIYFSDGAAETSTDTTTITPTTVAQSIVTAKMFVYPNPTDRFLTISNLPEGISTVSVFRMDGSKVLSTTVNDGNNALDVSGLRSGMYLLLVNRTVLKFSKL